VFFAGIAFPGLAEDSFFGEAPFFLAFRFAIGLCFILFYEMTKSIPIPDKFPNKGISYLNPDEATKEDLINVMGTSDVNELLMENKGKKPILLLAGEMVSGGKQDRMIGKDLILGPGKIRRINVFCIEHGRKKIILSYLPVKVEDTA